MQNEGRLTPAERELEEALGMLSPAAAIDRDRLMFRAGQASVRTHHRPWQGATAALAVALIASLGIRLTPQQPARSSIVQQAPTRSASSGEWVARATDLGGGAVGEGAEYLSLRDKVLAGGADVLPAPPSSASGAESPIQSERLFKARPASHRGFFGLEKWIDLGAQS